MASMSNAEIKRRIARVESDLQKVKPGSWTAQKLQESLDWLNSQLAKPRNERLHYEDGSL